MLYYIQYNAAFVTLTVQYTTPGTYNSDIKKNVITSKMASAIATGLKLVILLKYTLVVPGHTMIVLYDVDGHMSSCMVTCM